MSNLAFYLDSGGQVLPVRYLSNREHIAIPQADIGVRLTQHRLRNRHANVVADHLGALRYFKAGQVGLLGVGATLETSRQPDQLCRSHVLSEGIFSRT